MITGIDIVRKQLEIAAGLKLDIKQEDVRIEGHAIECRVNAENPKNFMPSPGTIGHVHLPGGPGIRVDSHIYGGYTVPPFYDSMIGNSSHTATAEILLSNACKSHSTKYTSTVLTPTSCCINRY